MKQSPNSAPDDDHTNQSPLDKAIEEILGKDNPYAYSVLTFIHQRLRQYNLGKWMEAHDVLHDAYRRGKTAEDQGKTIHNPHAWLKSTAFNIIRERSRAWSSISTDPQVMEELLPDGTRPEQALIQKEDVKKLQATIAVLAKADPYAFRLLYLRTIREYSWQEISDLLSEETRTFVSDVALRQQLSRAKKKFRAILHNLDKPSTEKN